MRRLLLLALATLGTLSLSAHDHDWRGPRRVVVIEGGCRPHRHWDEDRWMRGGYGYERRNEYRSRWDRDDDCGERVYIRPLPRLRVLTPPFQGHVEFRIR